MGRGNRSSSKNKAQTYIDPKEAFRAKAGPQYNCLICLDEGWMQEADADPNPDGSPGDPYPIQVACECEAGIQFGGNLTGGGPNASPSRQDITDDLPF